MKLKKYLNIALLATAASVMTSCMDLEPLSDLGDNLVWNSADNFQLFANQFYGYSRDFRSSISYNMGVWDGIHTDFRSDIGAGATLNTYSTGTNSIPSTDDNYKTLYKRIYYTNLLLKNAANFDNPASIEVPVGEAYFFRAYLYFELVEIYGDAILLTEPIDMDSEKLYQAQNDRGEVVDQIIADLNQAANKLPEKESVSGRLNKYAALAMISRVALYEGSWQKFHNKNTSRANDLFAKAKEAAKKVIDGGQYKLFYNDDLGEKSYRYLFTLEDVQCNPAGLTKKDNTEYIFSRCHGIDAYIGSNLTHAMAGNTYHVTRKMANMYLCKDGLPIEKSPLFKGYATAVSEFENRDARMDCNMLYHGESFWDNDGKWRTAWDDSDLANCRVEDVRSNTGYHNQKWVVERQVSDNYETCDYPVIRYAEVLLNYAEAAYEMNESITDEDLDVSLNLVRCRVNPSMPKLSNSLVSANGLSMREEIRRERTVELYNEGFRIDDLKRWATAVEEMNMDQLGVKVTGTWFETAWAAQTKPLNSDGCILYYTNRSWSEKNYLYPLPSDQLQLNPQLVQNPGWK